MDRPESASPSAAGKGVTRARHRLSVSRAAFVVAVLGAALVAVRPATVHAQGPQPVFRVGDDLTIESGETIDGSVTVLGADLDIEEGAEVTGDVVVVFGNASIAGRVAGKVTATGDLVLTDAAYVGGDVVALGSYEAGEATVMGAVRGLDSGRPLGHRSTAPAESRAERLQEWMISVLVGVLVAGVLGTLTAAVAPRGLQRVRHALGTRTAASFAVGCLAWILMPVAFVLLFVTVVGIPIVPIGFGLLLLLGWTALAQAVGSKLVPSIGTVGAALVGSAVMSAALSSLFFLSTAGFCAAASLGFVLSLAPLGAALMTLWGTRWWPSGPDGGAPDETLISGEPAPYPPGPEEPAAATPPVAPAPWTPAEPATTPTDWVPPAEQAVSTEPAGWMAPAAPAAPAPAAPAAPAAAPAELTRVPGITPVYALLLRQAGLDDLQKLATADPARVAQIASAPGVISVTVESAGGWVRAARDLIGGV